MLSVSKICNCKFLGEEFCVSSVMNLAYETIFSTFTGKGKLEHGTSKWDGGGMQVSCTHHFKGSKRYIDILNKKLSSKAGLINAVLNIVFELD